MGDVDRAFETWKENKNGVVGIFGEKFTDFGAFTAVSSSFMMLHHKYLQMLSCDVALSSGLNALKEGKDCVGAIISLMAGRTVRIEPEGRVAR